MDQVDFIEDQSDVVACFHKRLVICSPLSPHLFQFMGHQSHVVMQLNNKGFL